MQRYGDSQAGQMPRSSWPAGRHATQKGCRSEEFSFGLFSVTFLHRIFFQGLFTWKILIFFPPSKDSQILERENNYLVETLEEGQRLLVALAASFLPISKLHLGAESRHPRRVGCRFETLTELIYGKSRKFCASRFQVLTTCRSCTDNPQQFVPTAFFCLVCFGCNHADTSF